jgi:hypothetical protein
MRRTVLTAAFCLLSGAATAATMTPPYGPQTVRGTSQEEVAQATQPNRCLQAVSAEQHDKWLSVKRGSAPGAYRTGAKTELTFARLAAAQGDQHACWHRLGLAEELNAP